MWLRWAPSTLHMPWVNIPGPTMRGLCCICHEAAYAIGQPTMCWPGMEGLPWCTFSVPSDHMLRRARLSDCGHQSVLVGESSEGIGQCNSAERGSPTAHTAPSRHALHATIPSWAHCDSKDRNLLLKGGPDAGLRMSTTHMPCTGFGVKESKTDSIQVLTTRGAQDERLVVKTRGTETVAAHVV